ncbi:carboxylesterase family protein [Sinomonas gamaensis]|uniref:carboxylesterase family protein n=1 Tax=Sinomonas gamaensis TaxID=2565624 RepID=UPI0011092617|nr:carboxylesterase family protein [Sinomonas gamaensis]
MREAVVTRCRWARLEDDGDGHLVRAAVAPAPVGTVDDPVVFPQRAGGLDWLLGPAAAESPSSSEAFQVTVFAPADLPPSGAPLLVYLPGGGYVSGGPSVRWYDATELARTTGAVVAIVGYRLGAAACFGAPGFGASGATSPLVEDVLAGVEWVIDHARHFGANPDDVTLAGHSAGAWLAFVAAQDPALAGRVRRLALYSLPFQPPPGAQGSLERRKILAENLGDDDPSRADAALLTTASAAVNKAWAGRGLGVQPLAGGRLRPDVQDWGAAVGRLRVEQVLLATTAHEARGLIPPFASISEAAADAFRAAHFDRPEDRPSDGTPWERLTDDMTEHQFASVSRELAGELRWAGIAVHVSRFDVPSPLAGAGSPHCFDVPFVFRNREQWWDAPMLSGMDSVFGSVAAAWGEPLVRALGGEKLQTAPGFVRAVGLEDGSVTAEEVPDEGSGSPLRVREP